MRIKQLKWEDCIPTISSSVVSRAQALGYDPRRARLASLAGLATGEALTLRYYRDADLARWVRDTAKAEGQDVEPDYWRALFSLNGQMVTLSAISLKTMPLDQSAKRALLEKFVGKVKTTSK